MYMRVDPPSSDIWSPSAHHLQIYSGPVFFFTPPTFLAVTRIPPGVCLSFFSFPSLFPLVLTTFLYHRTSRPLPVPLPPPSVTLELRSRLLLNQHFFSTKAFSPFAFRIPLSNRESVL